MEERRNEELVSEEKPKKPNRIGKVISVLFLLFFVVGGLSNLLGKLNSEPKSYDAFEESEEEEPESVTVNGKKITPVYKSDLEGINLRDYLPTAGTKLVANSGIEEGDNSTLMLSVDAPEYNGIVLKKEFYSEGGNKFLFANDEIWSIENDASLKVTSKSPITNRIVDKYPLVMDQSWNVDQDTTAYLTDVGFSFSVEAGDFENVIEVTLVTNMGGNKKVISRKYYAPGLGEVYWEAEDENDNSEAKRMTELVRYVRNTD